MNKSILVFSLILGLLFVNAHAADSAYNPLQINESAKSNTLELVVYDQSRSREIPILVYIPTSQAQWPIVFFSHGLGGSRHGNAYMGKHWSARGYACVFLQHPGSDTSVWKYKPMGQRMSSMKRAASAENLMLRIKDVPAVIHQLEKWNQTPSHPLFSKLNLQHIGMSGHSFGALTTQSVSGQTSTVEKFSATDPRIKAAIAFSPSSPHFGNPKKSFGNVKIPWMLMTGTKDVSLIGDTDLASRLAVYPALPPGDKYEIVLYDAEHSAFTDRGLPADTGKRNPNHHRVILALSTAFWDAYLKKDSAALEWLQSDAPAGLMEKNDRWQKK